MKQDLLRKKIECVSGIGNTRAKPVADYLIDLKSELSMARSSNGRLAERVNGLIERVDALEKQSEEMQAVGIRRMDRFLELKTRVANMDRTPEDVEQPAVTPAPMLTPMKWAQLLIEQLPWKHDGRNNWLMSHGKGGYTNLLRKEWSEKNGRPWGKEVS